MDEIIKCLEPWQKKQLHEVADGMLLIYRTLARMQYIEDFDITEGPHDMSELLPFCRSLNVDDSIIYLYSILPYVEDGGDFVNRGAMLDLRVKRDIEEARNPMFGDDDESPRPWMTGLSAISNHDTALVYDARKHVIGMYCQEGFDSTDRNLRDQTPASSIDEDMEETGEDESEGEDTPDATQESQKEGDNDDSQMTDVEEEDTPSEQSEDDEGGNPWDEMEARPAHKVLRDIVRWYESLDELPGVGERSGADWDPEITEPLYVKHRWPSSTFDGEAFLVAKARACAEKSVKQNLQQNKRVRDELAELEKQLEVHKDEKELRRMRLCNRLLENPRHLEEEWGCRWEVQQIEERSKGLRMRIQAEKDKIENMTGFNSKPTKRQMVLDNLMGEIKYNKWLMESVKTQIAEAVDDDQKTKANRRLLPRLEKKAQIFDKAYKTYQTDKNVAPLDRPNYFEDTVDLRGGLYDAITKKKILPEAIELLRQFLENVPTEVKYVRSSAEYRYEAQRKALQQAEEQYARSRKLLLEQGYTGWPMEYCD
ncbi:hypothetical protein CC79DRAFT_1365744 [Sarocladium strictum]